MYISSVEIDRIIGRVALRVLDTVTDEKQKAEKPITELTGFLNGASAAISFIMEELKKEE